MHAHIPYKYLLSSLTHFINSNLYIGGESSSSGRGGGKGDKKERVDSSYVTFLLDLLGAIAAGARRVVLDAEAEREVTFYHQRYHCYCTLDLYHNDHNDSTVHYR